MSLLRGSLRMCYFKKIHIFNPYFYCFPLYLSLSSLLQSRASNSSQEG